LGGVHAERTHVFSARSESGIGEIPTAIIEKSIQVQAFKKAPNSPCKTGDRELVLIPPFYGALELDTIF
jgi:hypothetical protein